MAANCEVLRLLYRMIETGRRDDPHSILRLDFTVGFLPLLNVALIGTLLFVVRRLRSLRCRHATGPPPSPAGITYFSLHFLALGFLVSAFMPDAIESYLGTLEPFSDYAGRGWSVVSKRFGSELPSDVLDFSLFCLYISGPLLVLAWMGRMVARRCAATLPRRRFWVMTCLVSLGFAVVALAILLAPRPFEDERDVDLNFQVVDKDSGEGIGAAFLRLTDPFDSIRFPPRALTGADGRAQLTGRFACAGERTAFCTMGVFSPWGRWFEISASGFQPLRIPLTAAMGPEVGLDRPCFRKLALTKGETHDNSCRDISGIYNTNSNALAGARFKIEPDGRFAWFAWSCMPPHPEYGYVKRNEGEIEFLPVPHPGEKINPWMTFKYRTIRWGDRLYLSTTDDRQLKRFCRPGLAPNSAATLTCMDYLRDSGLPQLPLKVWVRFLLDEISLCNEDGCLRLALESLLSRQLRRREHSPTDVSVGL